ncbi:MAG: tRNA glutamyl-Q(34) synthetase GluQRS [Pseudomonadota bacterium]
MASAVAKRYSTAMQPPPSSSRPLLRFAPSPNGRLHLGHAFSALETWRLADALGGEVLLRIEDIDLGRTREAFVAGITEDLSWLGLTWPTPVRRQSQHFADYSSAADQLRSQGLLYPSMATRRDISDAIAGTSDWPCDPDGAPLYPRTLLGPETHVDCDGAAWRLDMRKAMARATVEHPSGLAYQAFDAAGRLTRCVARPERWGDVLLVRKETPTSYHLSVVVDDALQGITHVTRGADLATATDIHVLLKSVLGLPQPLYHHHPLITDAGGRKLSKRFQDTSLAELRAQGWAPDDVREAVCASRVADADRPDL